MKSDTFDQYSAISGKRCDIGHKFVLFTNRKLHTGFRLVPKSVTLKGKMAAMRTNNHQ